MNLKLLNQTIKNHNFFFLKSITRSSFLVNSYCNQFKSLTTEKKNSKFLQSITKSTGLNLENVKVARNPNPAVCYEDAIKYEKGSFITSTGALSALSGVKTGRSPTDKRIVDEKNHTDNIWWGPVNTKLSEESFVLNKQRAVDFLQTREKLYVVDAFAGYDPKYRIKIRVITSRAYHALFMWNMLIRPTAQEQKDFGEPDFTIYNAGQFPANKYTKGLTSPTSVSLSFDKKEMIILGTEYAGEMKKGVFTVMHYLMPLKGVLSLHTSANAATTGNKDVSLFFGLSGTGKTTLSADSARSLIGDDEHCWSDSGIFNIEGGCYAKAIDLSQENEPEIFGAIKFGSILENIVLNKETRLVDFSNKGITENTRVSYPIEFISNSTIPCLGGHPTNIILLTCDAFGVLPPVSKLTTEQAMYHFISGYTAKIAGTEEGVKEPQATFSACFGQPFLVWHPMKYAEMLTEKMKKHKTNVWLINTGWNGGPFGILILLFFKLIVAIIDGIHSGELNSSSKFENFPVFNLKIPSSIKNVPKEILNPELSYKGHKESSFNDGVKSLATLFKNNFKNFRTGAKDIKEIDYLIKHGGPQ
ncbi:Protein kinase C-like 1 [Clydaea vesicula]|uniref:Phosphoenolpyruvate carboxykinase (ATP) n=1 Tax=Clydaea vesicula TaxID=447962 RepID=A0AAD5U8C8_9FUNG|nr:Protein kinase C-like 1 [Clydaea vesicula]